MDYTINNNAKLFDDVIEVLSRRQDEPGVLAALDDLKAAKVNYIQRSIDHMMNCFVLAVHDLVVNPPSKELQGELAAVINDHYQGIFEVGSKLSELAHRYGASGGKPLSREEILNEVDERRGTSR